MANLARFPIVLHERFIEATRDTGYRSTGAAIAEIVDNAVQAKARKIRIFVHGGNEDSGAEIAVMDDGHGMDAPTLRRALQFGGSTRFGDRNGSGRFGMGLPNASVSQAKRVDVYTWRAPNLCIASHLDVDHIANGGMDEVPKVRRGPLPTWAQEWRSFSGTLVTWSKCDRLDNRRLSTITRKLHEPLGRMFRHFLWKGVKVWINGEPVAPVDPLFLHPSTPLQGAVPFGESLAFEVRVPGKPSKTSVIQVRFSELPVASWHSLPVEDKRRYRIVDGAGLSILRANREVDYGWWFFGAKRRENYDSWWRGELRFEPELDELFSITHSKQGINPTQELREILTPDLEAVARQLNSRVQAAFASVKMPPPPSEKPQPTAKLSPSGTGRPVPATKPPSKPAPAKQVEEEPYTLAVGKMRGGEFFDAKLIEGKWHLALNSAHTFYTRVYAPAGALFRKQIERLLVAHAMAEARLGHGKRAAVLRESWASQLAGLLEGHA